MLQKILKVGSSAAVTIPKKSLHGLGVAIGNSVNVNVNEDAGVVIIRPLKKQVKGRQSEARRTRIATLTTNFIERYRQDLEELARK